MRFEVLDESRQLTGHRREVTTSCDDEDRGPSVVALGVAAVYLRQLPVDILHPPHGTGLEEITRDSCTATTLRGHYGQVSICSRTKTSRGFAFVSGKFGSRNAQMRYVSKISNTPAISIGYTVHSTTDPEMERRFALGWSWSSWQALCSEAYSVVLFSSP